MRVLPSSILRVVPLACVLSSAAALCACEPVLLQVGPVREPQDAGVAPGWTGDAQVVQSAPDATATPEPKCVRIGHAPFVDFDAWGLIVNTPAELSCKYAGDGGVPVYGAGVISRKDGSPMMQGATHYSLRWKDANLLSLVVYGGATGCDVDMIYEELPDPNLPGLFGVLPTLPPSGCRDFVPSQTVASVQVDGIVPGAAVELCEQACPAP